ncbi:uncharacterized protein LOC62_02G002123 [Vanrija pseudolonga]|uniref:Alginate lyase domain-containing protein n=1 Tax=Vanrija pseudolonga TaxID=143232 RepID=A0AAF0Y823_9TREE|nr:hypothetical protein LOC62_02G002123 [Vanrija pseudolonga]
MVALGAIVTLVLALPALAAPTARGKPAKCPEVAPPTVVLDGNRLLATKKEVIGLTLKCNNGNGNGNGNGNCKNKPDPKGLVPELSHLVSQANSWLPRGPWTVTAKTMDVPGGTKNDYASQAPYWWASNWQNPSTGNKCPYIQRDGIRNPEVDNYTDRLDGVRMMTASYQLALAWWYTEDAKYRQKAGEVLREWFVKPETAMTPNLAHAQIIPCKNNGRAIGIIDFSQQYTAVLDAAAILGTKKDAAWSQADEDAFKAWNAAYLTWLTDSAFGKEELAAKNNHGTFAGMQIAGIASFLGKYDLARQALNDQLPRMDLYISANGSQPLETIRPTSFHYSTFTLIAYTRMALIGANKKVNVDVWGHKTPNGAGIAKAIEYIIPAAVDGQSKWPHQETHFDRFAAYDIVNYAADQGLQAAKAAVSKLEQPPGGGLWQLRPAPEQLDSIVGVL